MDPELAKNHIPKPSIFEYKSRDAIIYALGSKFPLFKFLFFLLIF